MTESSDHRADITAEAQRIIAVANEQGVTLRLLGGLAIRLHAPSATHRTLARSYPDIDLATPRREGQAAETLLSGLGYTPDKSFNLLNGASRLLFYDPAYERQVDVFVGSFEMCHRIPITERLQLEPLTLPLAELLLTKLQIVQINEKDLRDLLALLLDHPLGAIDHETINVAHISGLCGNDWGLWKTVTINLDKLRSFTSSYELPGPARQTIQERIDELRRSLDTAPKSLKWKTRAAIGERMRWYDLPEEVQLRSP
ncbi:MAG TPA: nucleotidyltransferase family protein [Herpetosiphonaceae bacterium]